MHSVPTLEEVVGLLKTLLVLGNLAGDEICHPFALVRGLPQHVLQQQAVVEAHAAPAAGVGSHLWANSLGAVLLLIVSKLSKHTLTRGVTYWDKLGVEYVERPQSLSILPGGFFGVLMTSLRVL